MINKEKYKKAFSKVHISNNFILEVEDMKKVSNKKISRLIASLVVCVAVVATATAAYATDFAGIKRTVQLWIYGEQEDVVVEFDGEGNYTIEQTDEEGNAQISGGGGMAFDGEEERPLTQEELIEEMNAPVVMYEEDGSVFVYWFEQKIDITDKFEDGVCYVKLENGEDTLYMTVKYNNGYATSSDSFIMANTFE